MAAARRSNAGLPHQCTARGALRRATTASAVRSTSRRAAARSPSLAAIRSSSLSFIVSLQPFFQFPQRVVIVYARGTDRGRQGYGDVVIIHALLRPKQKNIALH